MAVYKHKFKDAEYVGSVEHIKGNELPRIDLITSGSPCQDFSLAGKRKGMSGERSSLILEAIRLISECRPRVFIWENVKGTFSSNSGEDFAAILQAFANIGGYRLEWQLLNTSWFLPQNRERLYLVGYSTKTKRNWRGVFPIGSESKKNNRIKGHNLRANTICARYGNDANGAYISESQQPPQEIKVKSATPKEAVVEPKIIGYTRDAKGKVTDRHLKDEAGTIHSISGGGGNTDQFVQEQPIIGAIRGRNPENPNDNSKGIEYKQRFEYNKKGTANALTSDVTMNMVQETSYRIRRLTPIECERLQGFPDNHTEYGNYDGEVKKMSNTQRYKQCGNAVTVDVVQAIAEKIKPLL